MVEKPPPAETDAGKTDDAPTDANASHVIEPASSARAKCRGCGAKIAKGELRFGESVPNPFADGNTTIWFHLDCGAHRRPEPFLEALEVWPENPNDETIARLSVAAELGIAHPRATRVAQLECSLSGRAKCRQCKELIAKDRLRIKLEIFQDARFEPIGYIHLNCCSDYFGTGIDFDRVQRHLAALDDAQIQSVKEQVKSLATAES